MLMSELVTPLWWTSTAITLGPGTSRPVLGENGMATSSSLPPAVLAASVVNEITPPGIALRATSVPFR